MILSDPRQHKFASCSRRATALGCIWTLVEGLGFCGTVDSGTPVPRLQHTAEPGTCAPALLLTCWKNLYLRLRLCFPPHLLICTHPKSCQPVILPFCRVCTPALGCFLLLLREKEAPDGRCQQCFGLFLDPHPLTLMGSALLGDIHQPSEYPPGVIDSIIFPFCFTVSTFFLPGLFYFSLTFFFFPSLFFTCFPFCSPF